MVVDNAVSNYGTLLRFVFGFILVFTAGLTAPVAAQSVKFTDEGPRERSLVALRSTVIAAAKKRDINAFLRHVDPAAPIGDANATGYAAWRNLLQRKPELWDELVWVLEHGGKFGGQNEVRNRVFTAPFMAKSNLTGASDSHFVVVGRNIPAYAAPRRNSSVLATYSYELLKLEKSDQARLERPFYRSSGWVEIRTKDDKPAFLEARFVRFVKDFQLRFQRAGDTWQIESFLADD